MYGKTRGIPGSSGVHHVAYTVPDLDQAVAFFVDVLGAELAYRLGPVEFPDSDWMERYLGVDRKAAMDLAMLRLGPVTNLELFQYSAPGQRREMPRNSDWGGHHLALHVEDMDEAVAYLRAQPGVRILGEPQPLEAGSTRGDSWVYFLSPWGMQLELIKMPPGMSYERETTTRLYQPGGR
ncbi:MULTISPECIES: VOC family protein [Streptomyces]|uniref:VOC family protein n=1 Tax=Streptomyces TaxID=1883 RepID=UPI0016774EC9|nr:MULTISPECIES: VOC family protein [Streptomyces]MBK3523321.1 VOC family protein [Streptomyces sp. MBT70]GGS12561.1 glyoxalase [Streptomyces eurythermus]